MYENFLTFFEVKGKKGPHFFEKIWFVEELTKLVKNGVIIV